MADVKIVIAKNGPLRVTGDVEMEWADGTPVEIGKEKFSLCRCGASTNKPFCDGTHSRIGFEAAEAAVPESDENKAKG